MKLGVVVERTKNYAGSFAQTPFEAFAVTAKPPGPLLNNCLVSNDLSAAFCLEVGNIVEDTNLVVMMIQQLVAAKTRQTILTILTRKLRPKYNSMTRRAHLNTAKRQSMQSHHSSLDFHVVHVHI